MAKGKPIHFNLEDIKKGCCCAIGFIPYYFDDEDKK